MRGKMNMFEDENGKTYVAVDKVFSTKKEAVTIANRYFKTKKDLLKVESGKVTGQILEVGVQGDVWVVYKKEVKR